MNLVILFFAALSGVVASATTSVIFGKNNSKATIILNGTQSDLEAWRFYETLTAEAKDFNGKWSKVFNYDDLSGARLIRTGCVFSKIIKEVGSCSLTVHAAPGVTIDSSRNLIHYETPSAAEAALVSLGFESPALGSPSVYTTDDGRFTIEVEMSDGVARSLRLHFN